MKKDSKYTIVLIAHAYTSNPKKYHSLIERLKVFYPNSNIMSPKLPLSLFSFSDPLAVTQMVLKEMDKAWEDYESQKGNSTAPPG